MEVEQRPVGTVWVRVNGTLADAGAGRLAAGLRRALERKSERVVLDLTRLAPMDGGAADRMAECLRAYRDRIRLVLPRAGEFASLAAIFGLYR